MSDKQQLAAMGEHMSEQAAQPLCMAKRIEELEAQVRVMAELLQKARPYMDHRGGAGVKGYAQLAKEIDSALAGKMPDRVNLPLAMMPEDWVKGKYFPLHITTESGKTLYVAVDRNGGEVFVGGDAESSDAAKHFLREIGKLSPVVVPKGWRLVPVEATEGMLVAGISAAIPAVWIDSISGQAKMNLNARYVAMLSAAPSLDGTK